MKRTVHHSTSGVIVVWVVLAVSCDIVAVWGVVMFVLPVMSVVGGLYV